jgi:hypothetical protein
LYFNRRSEKDKTMLMGTHHSPSGRIEPGDSAVVGGSALPADLAAKETRATWLAMFAGNDFRDLPWIVAADAMFRSPVE